MSLRTTGWLACVLLWAAIGCGTTREKQATDQLLLSDAVDRAVARIDFSPLRGETVYLDSKYVRQIESETFVNADYIVSSLRQQMVLAGCLLQDDRDDAEFIAEARVGALGTDGHDVNYGIPGSQSISAAAALVTAIPVPNLPEISLARKADDSAATKIAVFAYHRESREPVWQSGLSVERSSAQAKWLLGAGPFQSGTIYEGTQFAGGAISSTSLQSGPRESIEAEDTEYRSAHVWNERLRNKLFEAPNYQYAQSEDVPEKSTFEKARPIPSNAKQDKLQVQPASYAEDTGESAVTED